MGTLAGRSSLLAEGRVLAPAAVEARIPVRRWHTVLHLSGGLALLLAAACLLAPWLPLADPVRVDLSRALASPGAGHWLGTDELGRDLLSRVLHAGHISLTLAGLTVAVGLTIGVTLGAFSGYIGGWVDAVLMRLVDGVLALPMLLVALAVLGVIGPSYMGLLTVLTLSHWVHYARLTRGLVVSLRAAAHLEAARALGAGPWQIMRWHILPVVLGPLAMQASLNAGHVILTIGSLSFLGMGIQPPTPEWGAMLVEARPYLDHAPHLVAGPGLALVITVFGFNALGGWLEAQ